MSRAFVSERDGWAFCTEKMCECMWADENGMCVFSQCRRASEFPQEGQSGESGPKAPSASPGETDKTKRSG